MFTGKSSQAGTFQQETLRQVHHGFRSEGRARNANTTLPSRKQCSLVDDSRPKTQFQAGTRSLCKNPAIYTGVSGTNRMPQRFRSDLQAQRKGLQKVLKALFYVNITIC
ncbi:MAG: hypothetical protein CME32_07055 [Gimesia sp.]|nr:hypothetical protein [Gimesia sp.]